MNAKSFLTLLPPTIFLLSYIMGFNDQTRALCFAIWIVSWWIFEVLPLGVTALIPLVILPIVGLSTLSVVASSYSEPILFLFLGGFIIARGLEKTGLSKKIALAILLHTSSSATLVLFGFSLATLFLSMFVSNTATTLMMIPVAMSVCSVLNTEKSSPSLLQQNFSTALFIIIAFSANIGGTLTPIGTPPNVVFLGFLKKSYQIEIDFWKWLLAMSPSGILMIAGMLLIVRWCFPYHIEIPKNFKTFLSTEFNKLKTTPEQRISWSVFLLAAFLWITKALWNYLLPEIQLSDTTIAMGCGILLFVPLLKSITADSISLKPVLDTKDINQLPWNIFLLFGGGMALAKLMKNTGIVEAISELLLQSGISDAYIIMLLVSLTVLWATEIMSNVALTVIVLPLIMVIGEKTGAGPIYMALPAAICSSFAFCLPIATPPNAIVFSSGQVSVKQMMKAGLWANLLGWVLTTHISIWIFMYLF